MSSRQPSLFGAAPRRSFRVGEIETQCRKRGLWPVIGTDEVGRGPLAGPVVAAAVVLKDRARLPGLDDSKLLTEEVREALVPKIQQQALAWSVVEGPVALIDDINILHASLQAMREAVQDVWAQLQKARESGQIATSMPRLVLVDGNKTIPTLQRPGQRAIVKGDQRSRAIAAASVLAKVHRDKLMVALDALHPGYGLAQHKGYPTPQHLAALKELGPTPLHRRSFAPVAAAIAAHRPGS